VLGRFLEYSLATPDIRASLDFYTRLGFSQASVGEAWRHPYAVVTDGRICLGLHQEETAAPSMTFVKPGLLKFLATLEARGLEFEFRRLGNDVFNEIGWRAPCGQLLRLTEARTFSPSKRRVSETSTCGYFLEIALPARDVDAAKTYWESFGFVGIDETAGPMPHVACTSDHIDLGLYDPALLRRPALRFEVEELAGALARLAEVGVLPSGEIPPPLRHGSAAALTSPEGTSILLSPAAAP